MKIEIIDVNYATDDDSLTLEECGFKFGDVVEVFGHYIDGDLSIRAIRETEFVTVGDGISISEHEYKVIEE
ncbi:hypothetical protein HOR71_gp13 [Escherichia phage vB_EcoS_ESCO41]|uniref:Uncharacterized protein n=1 Tax=Escherichia phage vB_EcoS_ESCO41 TaxID=2496547 RepID=A0A1U9WQY9_9CAUD|nr:hypothetical protein HOR71_gp13 [Escherichia phage vB_EcoS_ESCO41]AQY55267.1 hypothetical protein ESCO41_00039 [Escherichia phage vB_EcoS_ESCO41]